MANGTGAKLNISSDGDKTRVNVSADLDPEKLQQGFMSGVPGLQAGANSVLAPPPAPEPLAPSANLPEPPAAVTPNVVSQPQRELPQPAPDAGSEALINDMGAGRANVLTRLEELAGGGQSPEQKAMRAELEGRIDEQQEQRQGTIAQLQKALEAEAQRNPSKLKAIGKGLANFSDAFYGTDISKNVMGPESEEKRQNRLNLLRRAISQEQGALTKSEIDRLKQALGGGQTGTAFARILSATKSGQEFQQRRADAVQKDIFKEQNKIDAEFRQDAQQFNTLDESLSRGDYQSVMSVLGQFARAVSGERGVLTDKDIERVIPRNIRGDAAKIKAYFSNTPTAAFGGDNGVAFVKNLRALISIAKQKARKRQTDRVDFLSTRVRNQERFRPARKTLVNDLSAQRKEIIQGIPFTPEELKQKRIEELKKKAGK